MEIKIRPVSLLVFPNLMPVKKKKGKPKGNTKYYEKIMLSLLKKGYYGDFLKPPLIKNMD